MHLEEGDLSLPLGSPVLNNDPWGVASPVPTNLIALWPGEAAPELEEVVAALSRTCSEPVQVLSRPQPDEPSALWLAMLDVPGLPVPIGVWAEPMRPMLPEHLRALNAESVKWALGVVTSLLPEHPLEHFLRLMRLVGKTFPDSSAILDVNKEGWHTRDELESELLNESREPAESLLWMVHAIGADNPPTDNSKVWIYTQGLRRCGRPELEMLEVPYRSVGAAISLINAVGELVIEESMPEPGEPFEIGAGMEIVFQPWRTVAPFVSEGSLGGMDRRDHTGEAADGARAVLCAKEPIGSYRKLWVWPEAVVQQVIQTGKTVLYQSRRAFRRQAALARAAFDALTRAFETIPPALVRADSPERQAVLLIRAGLPRPDAEAENVDADADEIQRCEYLWFEVQRFHEGQAEGILVNQPATITHLKQGDVLRIEREMIWDWQLLTRAGHIIGPDEIDHLDAFVDHLVPVRSSSSSSSSPSSPSSP